MAMSGVAKSSRTRSKRGGRISEINVTPMVDVMLVLLVIFMVTAPMITAGVNIDLPETNAEASRSDEKPLEITVDKNGKLYIAQKRIPEDEFSAKLEAIAAQNPKKLVYIRGDKRVDYGKFAEVMGEINAAGFTRLTILTGTK